MITSGSHIRFVDNVLPAGLKQRLKPVVKGYRSFTRRMRVLPDFIIIGARRCGTTSLYNYLTEHPDVLPALKKEIFFFDLFYDKGVEWYRWHFPTRIEKRLREAMGRSKVITGEATPSYIFDAMAPKRIHSFNPNAKLIVCLRNPVETAISAYNFGLKMKTYTAEEVVFEKVVSGELDYVARGGKPFFQQNGHKEIDPHCTYLARGRYIDLLEPWFNVFPDDQIKVVISEQLFENPNRVYNEVLEFLGLQPHKLRTYETFNSNEYGGVDAGVKREMASYFAPHNRRLREFLKIDIDWD
jgi:hypothetical protein